MAGSFRSSEYTFSEIWRCSLTVFSVPKSKPRVQGLGDIWDHRNAGEEAGRRTALGADPKPSTIA